MEASYWFIDVPDKTRFPRLQQNLNVDVCIVGGGIAGLSAAYFLAKSGAKVALIEANNLGAAASGHTTAFVTCFLDSTEATIKAWEASKAAAQLIKEVVVEEKMSCDWQDVDGICFSQKEDLSTFKKTCKTYKKVDQAIEYYEGGDAAKFLGFPAKAAFHKKDGEGQLHIRKFLLGLAESVQKYGGNIFEESRVMRLKTGDKIVAITVNGRVESDWLIVASGAPPQEFFPEVSRKLTHIVSYVIQANFPENKPFTRSLFWDDLEAYHYFRWVSDRDLILGGEDRVLPGPVLTGDPHRRLEDWLISLSNPDKFSVVNRWAGGLFYTPDVLPFVGPHRLYGERIIFATGWGGNGITLGFLSGQIARDIIQKKESLFQEIFDTNR